MFVATQYADCFAFGLGSQRMTSKTVQNSLNPIIRAQMESVFVTPKGIIIKSDAHGRAFSGFVRIRGDRRNRPIGYAEQCLWMPAIKIKNPGARGSVELLMHRSCIRDQFAGRRRTACWNQSPYWVLGQYLRLTPPNPVDPGPYLVIVANRHATGKLCWRAHPRQAMRSLSSASMPSLSCWRRRHFCSRIYGAALRKTLAACST